MNSEQTTYTLKEIADKLRASLQAASQLAIRKEWTFESDPEDNRKKRFHAAQVDNYLQFEHPGYKIDETIKAIKLSSGARREALSGEHFEINPRGTVRLVETSTAKVLERFSEARYKAFQIER